MKLTINLNSNETANEVTDDGLNEAEVSEDVFDVRKIFDHGIVDGAFCYKVSWEGYGPDDDSWEPYGNLIDSSAEAIAEYHSTLTEQQIEDLEALKIQAAKEAAAAKKSAKKAKGDKATKKAEKRKKNGANTSVVNVRSDTPPEDFSEDDDKNDDAFEPEKKKAKKSSSKSSTSTSNRRSSQRSSVPTKAELKSFEKPSRNSAKMAAIKHRQGWLDDDDDSSDGEEKETVQLLETPTVEPVQTPKETQRSSEKSKDRRGKNLEVTKKNEVSSSSDGNASDWVVNGIAQKGAKIAVLLTNTKTHQKIAPEPEEAFKLAGWGLCEYLLERATF